MYNDTSYNPAEVGQAIGLAFHSFYAIGNARPKSSELNELVDEILAYTRGKQQIEFGKWQAEHIPMQSIKPEQMQMPDPKAEEQLKKEERMDLVL